MSLEGKTIARVVDLGYDGQALVFTDGTGAHFQGTGYETDGCSVDEASEMDVVRMEAEAENRRREEAAFRERAIARRELKARIQRNVSPAAWLHWRKVHVTMNEAFCELMAESIRSDMSRQVFNVGNLATVPPAKPKARRS